MPDTVFTSWLAAQHRDGMDLARRSDVLHLVPEERNPPARYIAEFHCDGLLETPEGIQICRRHVVGICFPDQYLREPCHPGQVLTWLVPDGAFQPNIKAPFCCIGHIAPGMSLVSLLYQLYQMISWQKFTPREDDALNKAACRWARANMHRFPIDPRRSLLADVDAAPHPEVTHDQR